MKTTLDIAMDSLTRRVDAIERRIGSSKREVMKRISDIELKLEGEKRGGDQQKYKLIMSIAQLSKRSDLMDLDLMAVPKGLLETISAELEELKAIDVDACTDSAIALLERHEELQRLEDVQNRLDEYGRVLIERFAEFTGRFLRYTTVLSAVLARLAVLAE